MRPKCDHSLSAESPLLCSPTLPHTPKNINSVEQLSTCKNLLVTNQHVHTMERNYCWGTILPRVFRGIINSLKKSMCKILLIKTKQNPYQCSADSTNKVTSRTGRCHGHGAPRQAQEQLPGVLWGWLGAGSTGGDRSRTGVAAPAPRGAALGALTVWKCWDRSWGGETWAETAAKGELG